MLPRFHTGGVHRVPSCASLARQARHVCTGTSGKRSGGAVAPSRLPAVVAECRLVLRPTGTGSTEHIGDKVSLPQAIPLNEGIFEVGRASPADIRINIPTVSSRHALLRVEDNRVCVTDLNSTNGTLVNGEELSPLLQNIEVEVGSEIVFGDHFLARFRLDEVPDHLLAEQLAAQQAEEAAATAAAAAMMQRPELSDQASVHPNNATVSS